MPYMVLFGPKLDHSASNLKSEKPQAQGEGGSVASLFYATKQLDKY